MKAFNFHLIKVTVNCCNGDRQLVVKALQNNILNKAKKKKKYLVKFLYCQNMFEQLIMNSVWFSGLFMSWPMERYQLKNVAFIATSIYTIAIVVASFSVNLEMLCVTHGFLAGMFSLQLNAD